MAGNTATTAPTNTIDKALAEPVSLLDRFINRIADDHYGWEALAIASGMRILVAILILVAASIVGGWLNRRLQNMHHLDKTLRSFLGRCIKYLVMAIAIVTVIGLFGIPMASLLAVMGAAGLAIGLALQGTLSNVAAGVMILILRPFRVGDFIDYSSAVGTVQVLSLGLFGTELTTADNVFVYTPNSKIWGGSDIKNYSRNLTRREELKISVKADQDPGAAISAIMDVLKKDGRILQEDDHKPEVVIDALSAGATALVIRFWSKSAPTGTLRTDVTREVRAALAAHNIALA